ncbi:hypothetical protein KC315_g577 [Hortaea werneckii]|nr:hypothetical protein KC315_g577 [Hortaea werneckii]KAI7521431.1 hypothetical protein KC331_g19761 [Hortaea werneckii]
MPYNPLPSLQSEDLQRHAIKENSIYHGFHAGLKFPPRPPTSSTIFILLLDRNGSIELLLPDPTLAIALGGLDLWRSGLSESASLPSATTLVVASILLRRPLVNRDAGIKAELAGLGGKGVCALDPGRYAGLLDFGTRGLGARLGLERVHVGIGRLDLRAECGTVDESLGREDGAVMLRFAVAFEVRHIGADGDLAEERR